MILRKPYAFFIKFFRLYHVVLTLISIYLTYRTYLVLSFYNDYSSTIVSVIGQDLNGTLLYGWYLSLPFIALLVMSIILVIMIFKKKPFTFYILSIISFVFLIIIQQVVSINLNSLSERLMDVRTVLLVRDFVIIVFLAQIVNSVILLVRSIGFDVGKFGFKEDLIKLDITDEDREEFELDINVDYNLLRRKVNHFIRKSKYIYKENKLFVILVSFVFVTFLSISVLTFSIESSNVYSYNQVFSANGVSLEIEEVYITNTDYKNNLISEDSSYVLVKINTKKIASGNVTLENATMKLKIGNYYYIPTTVNKEKFIEFGKIYLGEELSTDYESKTLIYEIPNELVEREMVFEYINKAIAFDDLGKLRVELEPLFVDEYFSTDEYILGEKLKISNEYIGEIELAINSYDINDLFIELYSICYDECYTFSELIYPEINTNYEKTVIKMDASFESDYIDGVFNLYDFLEKFAVIEYEINETTKTANISTEIIPSRVKNQEIYFTVLEEVENATSIKLKFQIKDSIYYYTLK